ncbi:MAG: hypothetical protein GW938_17215 [Leptospira sp.]|nr:hypothetical protein [Leptospira sp.]
MTAEEMFNMTDEEFLERVKEESQVGTEPSFNHDPETFEEQIEKFASFKQTDSGIKHLLKAASLLDSRG